MIPAVARGGRFGESKACKEELESLETRFPRNNVDEKKSETSGIG